MKILFLSPQPFYQDRGTPIAVRMILEILSARGEHVDLLTYPEGTDVQYPNLAIYRIRSWPLMRHIQPGFSFKKMICDFFIFFKALRLAQKNHYDVVHAVEESVFIALALKWLLKIPYIYDVDSSLPQQMIEAYRFLKPLKPLLIFFERLTVKNAEALAVVCEALEKELLKHGPRKTFLLQDTSKPQTAIPQTPKIRAELGLKGIVIMYAGNLAPYQGIDLLLESFALALTQSPAADLVMIGGDPSDIQKYQGKSSQLGIQSKVHLIGPKPVEHLMTYLTQADILVSPRLKGVNTPMKLYTYLKSGKPILATDLLTHRQILDQHTALLCAPDPSSFSQGMLNLMKDEILRGALGQAGEKLFQEKYSYEAFSKKLNEFYDWILENVVKKQT